MQGTQNVLNGKQQEFMARVTRLVELAGQVGILETDKETEAVQVRCVTAYYGGDDGEAEPCVCFMVEVHGTDAQGEYQVFRTTDRADDNGAILDELIEALEQRVLRLSGGA